jgi:hypothetical protein
MLGSIAVRHGFLRRRAVVATPKTDSGHCQEGRPRRGRPAAALGAFVAGAAIGIAFGACAGELGFPASALGEFAGKDRPSFQAAPSLAPGSAVAPAIVAPPAPAASVPASPPPVASRGPARETVTGLDEYEARCFVKIDGKVLVSRGCRILRDGAKSVVFEIDDGALTIDLRQGRVWTARLEGRDFGNVYKTGECWGAQGFYACDRGRK